MRLCDITAQEAAVRTLKHSIGRSSIAHAYLFTGLRSVGKAATALAFASALNCSNPSADGDACGLCPSCRRIEGDKDLDVQVIPPEGKGGQTRIEQMQEMIKGLSFGPIHGKYRVCIIEQADTLNPHSANCILKILEEPPAYVVLILLSCNPTSLLPTIRSRCRVVRFRLAGRAEIEEILRAQFELPEDRIHLIAACSQGAVGRAVRMAQETDLLEEREAVLRALRESIGPYPVAVFKAAETLRLMAEGAADYADPEEQTRTRRLQGMLDYILSWYDDLLALKARGADARLTNLDQKDLLGELSERYSAEGLRAAIRSIMDTRRYLEGNITPQLALENMFFDLRPDGA